MKLQQHQLCKPKSKQNSSRTPDLLHSCSGTPNPNPIASPDINSPPYLVIITCQPHLSAPSSRVSPQPPYVPPQSPWWPPLAALIRAYVHVMDGCSNHRHSPAGVGLLLRAGMGVGLSSRVGYGGWGGGLGVKPSILWVVSVYCDSYFTLVRKWKRWTLGKGFHRVNNLHSGKVMERFNRQLLFCYVC